MASAVTLPEAQHILAQHNCARQRYGVQPLKWDWQLAADAALHAERCVWAHASDIGQAPPTLQGENLSLAAGRAASVDGWLTEERNYACADAQCLRDQCGHWTQVLWHDTQRIGCARKTCADVVDKSGASIGFRNAELLVCRYSPPGNYVGRQPCSAEQCAAALPCSAEQCAVTTGDGSECSDSSAVVLPDTVENRQPTMAIDRTVLQVIAFAVALVVFLMAIAAVWGARRYFAWRPTSNGGKNDIGRR